MGTGDERSRNLEGKYDGYTVYDRDGDKIGKVDELFVNETDREEYIGVKMGLFGISGMTMIPLEIVGVDEGEESLRVDESKDHIKDAPHYGDQDEVDPEYEDRVRQHFGLDPSNPSAGSGSYSRHSDSETDGGRGAGREESEEGQRESNEGRQGEDRGEGRGGYGDEEASAGDASGSASAGDREGSGGEIERSEDKGSVAGYRDEETGGQGEGTDSTSGRRRVRRRIVREESEEVLEEEDTSGRSE